MPLDNALWKAAFTGIVSNTTQPSYVLQTESLFIRKGNLVSISLPGSVLMSIADAAVSTLP